MRRTLLRAIGFGVAGAVAGAVGVLAAYQLQSTFEIRTDRDLPRLVTGLYEPERAGDETYSWTSARVELILPDASRRQPWTCGFTVKSGHPPSLPRPEVDVLVDGVAVAHRPAPDNYESVGVAVPARAARDGLVVALTVTPTFVPSSADSRTLGVQLSGIACSPAGLALPPGRAISAAAVSAAVAGVAVALIPMPALGAIVLLAVVVLGQSIVFTLGAAPYTSAYLARMTTLGAWVMGAATAAALLKAVARRQPFSATAGLVLAASAVAVYVKLGALLHPSKPIVDAVFHAHRLEWVLDGRLYFSQLMPDGVRFPYAIGLYVVAAPFAALAHDHVALLRVVCAAAEGLAGVLMYPIVARGDRRAGVIACLLFLAAPMSFGVEGNANLTNHFGQSAAVVALAAASTWTLASRGYLQALALTLLTTLALLCHVSTFGFLTVAMATLAVVTWFRGRPALTPAARWIGLATVASVVLAVVLYYGRPEFYDVYRSLGRVGTSASAAPAAEPPAPAAPAHASAAPEPGAHALAVNRAVTGLTLSARALGWPTCLLSLVGLWPLSSSRWRDRSAFAILALAVAYLVFFVFGVLTPVKPGLERYAYEFVARVTFAASPAAILLAARGGGWLWQRAAWGRLACVALVAWALVAAGQQWLGWIE